MGVHSSHAERHAYTQIYKGEKKKRSACTFVDSFSAGCGRFGQGETLKQKMHFSIMQSLYDTKIH